MPSDLERKREVIRRCCELLELVTDPKAVIILREILAAAEADYRALAYSENRRLGSDPF